MTKIYLYLALGAAVIGGVITFTYNQRSIGGEAERLKQERANADFRNNQNKGAVDFDTCDRAGGLYDFRKATCKFP